MVKRGPDRDTTSKKERPLKLIVAPLIETEEDREGTRGKNPRHFLFFENRDKYARALAGIQSRDSLK